MTQLTLSALSKQKLELPVAPQAMMRVIQSLDDPDASSEMLARDISNDPILTAQLLRAANSAYFGLIRAVETPNDALRMLGLNKVRALTLATAMRASFSHISSRKLDAVWSVSMDTADIALSLAGMIDLDRATAYTCGMLHAVGMLVMHSAMPELIEELDITAPPMAHGRVKAERAAFGYTYADAGAAMLQRWHLPRRFVDALENQFRPLENDRHEVLAGLVCLAGWRARADYCQLDRSHMATSYPDQVGLILNLDHDMMLGDIPGRNQRVTEFASTRN